ncbi:ATP-binding cassette, sub-B (MDR TAP), member 4, partial [Blyttiomyces sp. JEL0837]
NRKVEDESGQPPSKQQQQQEQISKPVSYFDLYRFADSFDTTLIILGVLVSIVVGVAQPIIVFGNIMQTLITYPYTKDRDDLESNVKMGVIYLVVIGSTVTVASYFQLALWMWTGERQTKRIREEYLAAVLRQDVAWFDRNQTGDVTTRMTSDVITIQDGISEKVGQVIQSGSTFTAGFIIAFVKGWRLALVLCAAFPLLGVSSMLMAKTMARRQGKGSNHYAKAGAVAQEVLSAIRTVVAFGGEKREVVRYFKVLKDAEVEGVKGSLLNGASSGLSIMIFYLTYALGFWYGGSLVGHGMTGGEVVNVFFAIIIGGFALGQLGSKLPSFSSAIGAGAKIFETIDRVSPIDPSSTAGEKLGKIHGVIEFKNIDFHYPQRPDVPILKNFSLKIHPGQTVALVGGSGSGKSTIIKLLERFYNPVSGSVHLDNIDIRSLNVSWLRNQIGIVSQEPVLFDQTVRQNLVLGMKDEELNGNGNGGRGLSKSDIDARVKKACVVANAWDFIQKLPNGVDTSVGEAGTMMSGGQKQRIAIARAIMRDPSILLLDEATSALDTQSERVVQEALDNASRNRTTIVVAHRLSTIKNADVIVVMSEGTIVEQGTHNELLERNGAYALLVRAQALKESELANPESPTTSTQDLLTSAVTLRTSHHSRQSLSKKDPNMNDDEVSVNMDDKEIGNYGSENARERIAKKRAELEKEMAQNAILMKRKLPWGRLWKLNQPEYLILVVGVIGSAGAGVMFPLFSLIFSSVITVFGKEDPDRTNGVHFWALMFVLLSIGGFLSNFLSISMFGIAGEKLTCRLRLMTYEALLRMEIGYFDEEKCSTGALCGHLAEDATQVQGLVGRSMGSIVQIFVTMATGLVIAFVHGWELTLIVLCVVPFIGLAGAMQVRAMTGFGSKTKEAYEDASIVANEVIDQIRTVMTLTKEKLFLDAYKANIVEPHRLAVKGAFVAAFGYGVSQGIMFFAYALSFYAGSRLVLSNVMESPDVLTVMFAVIFTAMSAGQASSFAPNYVKAKLAAFNIFDIVDRKSRIDHNDQG